MSLAETFTRTSESQPVFDYYIGRIRSSKRPMALFSLGCAIMDPDIEPEELADLVASGLHILKISIDKDAEEVLALVRQSSYMDKESRKELVLYLSNQVFPYIDNH